MRTIRVVLYKCVVLLRFYNAEWLARIFTVIEKPGTTSVI